jgi:hypothetical protein
MGSYAGLPSQTDGVFIKSRPRRNFGYVHTSVEDSVCQLHFEDASTFEKEVTLQFISNHASLFSSDLSAIRFQFDREGVLSEVV